MVFRSAEGDVVFGWLWQQKRDDGQAGYNCSIFRNESERLSSEIILEAERKAWVRWPGVRLFTYVDSKKVRPKRDPGRCFRCAGWRECGRSINRGLVRLEKNPEVAL